MNEVSFKQYSDIIKSFDIPEINKAMSYIDSALYEREEYKNKFQKIVNKYKEILQIAQQQKDIQLNKKYWVTEWSWSPMCDGRFVYEEVIREHVIINNIDCYFTNKNNRVYFKEDIYEDKEDAEKAVEWQNSFGYDYETIVSRENDIRKIIDFQNCHWIYKK